jgi:hypothetical protein
MIKLKVLSHNFKSDLDYVNVFREHFNLSSITLTDLKDIHMKDNSIEHQCLPFIEIRRQKITTPQMFLLGGKPFIAQGKDWSKCSESGERRMRNICIGIRCASIEGTEQENMAFKVKTKHSTSLFFTNGSIFLVRTTEQGRKSTRVSKELKDLAETNQSYKIIRAEMFDREDADHDSSSLCKKYHVFCGDQSLCIGVERISEPSSATANAGDTTNYHKAIEDDFVKLVAKGIFNDKSFATSRTFRFIAFTS